MLGYEALIEQAKINNLPINKMRGIMREYIQTLMLKYLYVSKWQDKFYFFRWNLVKISIWF